MTKPVQNLHIMRGKLTSNLQLSAFSTWNSLNLLSSYNDARTKDATLPTTDTHVNIKLREQILKITSTEQQKVKNPKSKITRKYSNILYNAFCKVKYHYNLIEAVNSLFSQFLQVPPCFVYKLKLLKFSGIFWTQKLECLCQKQLNS